MLSMLEEEEEAITGIPGTEDPVSPDESEYSINYY